MKPRFIIARRLATVSAIAFTASAHAASLTWDTVSGDGTTITAGSGSWDTSTVIWNNAGADVAWSQTNTTTPTNTATFAGADGTYAITVGTDIAATSLTFSNSGYTLSAAAAQTIRLNGSLTVAAGKTATIGGNVSVTRTAAASTDVTGGGTLDVQGTNAKLLGNSNIVNVLGGSTVNIKTGGTINTSSQVVVGTATSGTLNVSAGSVDLSSGSSTGNLVLANSGTGTVSGALVISNTGSVLNRATGGGLRFGTTSATATGAATGSVDLDGGTLEVARVYEGGGTNTQTSTFNFNGGTLIVRPGSSNAANFMTGLDSANVKSGGAKINTNGVDTTIGQALLDGSGGGGLTKQGNGTLTLTGANTYTGDTVINGGKLNLNAPYSAITATTINSGARLRVTTAATPSSLSSVTVNTGGGLEANVGTYTIGQLAGLSATDFNAAGDYKVDLAGTGVPAGDITVLTYTNKSGTGVPSLGTTPVGVIGTVEDTGSAIVIHAQLAYIWTPGTGNWDTTTPNWAGLGSTFVEGNAVAFPEIAGTNTVTLTADRSPSSVTIANNSTSTYTFTGSAITGSATLAKSGTGVVNFDVANSYTGTTTISSGGVIAKANDTLGTAAAGTTIASGAALGLSNSVTYSTAEPVSGSGVANTTALGDFAAVQRGVIQAVSGSCSFAGPVEINAAGVTRFGTQNGASLTLSGPITMATGVSGVQALFRTGTDGDFVTLSNSGNHWDLDTVIFAGVTTPLTSAATGVRLGTDNALPTGVSVVAGGGSTSSFTTLDLNGNDQELNGLASSNGRLHIVNSDSVNASTLTLNPTVNKSNYTITANLTVIEDGAGKINLVKSGSFTQTLHDPNTYSGSTTINGGSLQLGSFVSNPRTGSIPNSTAMTIAAGANFDVSLLGSYAIPSSMPVTLKLDGTAAGTAGKIKAAGLDITNAVVTLDPITTLDDSVYILADYTAASLTGTQFASVNTIPGYTLDYAYNGGTQIALVQNVVPGYSSWIGSFPAVGGLNQPGDDPDNDGMDNLLEFVLNGNPTTSDTSIMPKLVVGATDFEFTYQRRDNSVSPETTQTFEWGTTLADWPGSAVIPAADATVGVASVDVGTGSPDDGITDTVKISIPKSEAGSGGRLFGRLKITKP